MKIHYKHVYKCHNRRRGGGRGRGEREEEIKFDFTSYFPTLGKLNSLPNF
jgi:hypothetical protein